MDRCGLLDLQGNPKPSFGALEFLAIFPKSGSRLEIDDKDIEGIFGVEGDRYCLLVWNMAKERKSICLEIENLPEKKHKLCIYQLDDEHPVPKSKIKPIKVEEVDGASLVISERLPAYGTICLTLSEREESMDGASIDPKT